MIGRCHHRDPSDSPRKQDARLREIEQDPYLNQAQSAPACSGFAPLPSRLQHANHRPLRRAQPSKCRAPPDLERWGQRGLEGLADGTAPGNPPRITEEAGTSFMEEKLPEERTWNATQLAARLLGRASG